MTIFFSVIYLIYGLFFFFFFWWLVFGFSPLERTLIKILMSLFLWHKFSKVGLLGQRIYIIFILMDILLDYYQSGCNASCIISEPENFKFENFLGHLYLYFFVYSYPFFLLCFFSY